MKSSIQYIVLGIVAVIAVFGLFLPVQKVMNFLGTAGDTQSTPKMAQIQCNTATPTYITADNKYQLCALTNNDANDRTVNGIDYSFDTLGTISTSTTAKFQIVAATTTSAAVGLNANANVLLNQSIATSTPFLYVSTSTPGVSTSAGTSDFVRIWKAGSTIVLESPIASTTGNMWFKVTYLAQ